MNSHQTLHRSANLRDDRNCEAGSAFEALSVDEAIDAAMRLCLPLSEAEILPLRQATGRVLSAAIAARVDLPMFDNSAMDGFAVRLSSFIGEGPWLLPIVGRVAAGQELAAFEKAGAIQILTGAPVPSGFDAVIKQEECEVLRGDVLVRARPEVGSHIRRRGEHLSEGDVIASAGEVLNPIKLGLLAAQGIESISVFRKLRVAVIETGNELYEPGTDLRGGQIYGSNGAMLGSLVSAYPWIETAEYGIAKDDTVVLVQVLCNARQNSDVILTTGGVSGGEEDHVVASFREIGATVSVPKVAMRPGKPLKIGSAEGVFLAGLPGNPNAALATFLQIVLPAMKKAAGIVDQRSGRKAAIADFHYEKKAARTDFLPARIISVNDDGIPLVSTATKPNSSDLVLLAEADGYVVVLPEDYLVEPGSKVRFESFPWA